MKIGHRIIMERAIATYSAQQSVVGQWVWQEKSPSEYKGEMKRCDAQLDKVSNSRAEVNSHVGLLESRLGLLHDWTVDALTMARVRFRRDPVAVALLRQLSANSHSRSETMAEALAFLSVWQTVGPEWSPLEEVTFETFSALLEE